MIYYNKHLKFFYCTINLLQNYDQFNSFIFILQKFFQQCFNYTETKIFTIINSYHNV